MRFTKQKELQQAYFSFDKAKSTKIVTKFLWLPLTTNDMETRWLEKATIQYQINYEDGILTGRNYFWEPRQFVDKE